MLRTGALSRSPSRPRPWAPMFGSDRPFAASYRSYGEVVDAVAHLIASRPRRRSVPTSWVRWDAARTASSPVVRAWPSIQAAQKSSSGVPRSSASDYGPRKSGTLSTGRPRHLDALRTPRGVTPGSMGSSSIMAGDVARQPSDAGRIVWFLARRCCATPACAGSSAAWTFGVAGDVALLVAFLAVIVYQQGGPVAVGNLWCRPHGPSVIAAPWAVGPASRLPAHWLPALIVELIRALGARRERRRRTSLLVLAAGPVPRERGSCTNRWDVCPNPSSCRPGCYERGVPVSSFSPNAAPSTGEGLGRFGGTPSGGRADGGPGAVFGARRRDGDVRRGDAVDGRARRIGRR